MGQGGKGTKLLFSRSLLGERAKYKGRVRNGPPFFMQGSTNPSARTYFIMYNEATLGGLRFGPWKSHFKEPDGSFYYYRDSGFIFNLRMDLLEEQDGQKSNDLATKKAFGGGMIRDMLAEHCRSHHEYLPRQKGDSLRAQ